MNNFFSNVQQFLHSVTTNDRYASTGGGRPSQNSYGRRTVSGGFGPAAPLTSDDGTIYQSPIAEQPPLHSNNPYSSKPSSRNNSNANLANSSQTSLNRITYAPGMRSAQLGNGGNIQLQEYADGAPPPPAPAISWKRIDRWMEANYTELGEEINDEATSYDLNELEADLECTLPLDVRDSFLIHDGQERGSRPCGAIFGLTLLDLEQVAEEWTHWKNTATRISAMARSHHANQRAAAANAAPGPSSASPTSARRPGKPAGKMASNLNWLDQQESVPEGAIQRVYAHPGWIPLISDFLGNNIGIDLAPGPKGRWGQVILFGREFDRKYVVASSWAAFLMNFADDLENGNHYIYDETEAGEFSFRASNGRVIPYFDVMRSRADRLERQNRKPPGPSPYHGLRPGSQTNLTSGPRISPRNSTNPAVPPGRNVSGGNFRRPNPGPAMTKEARLISPMNSTTNLPSAGLTKSPPPLISTSRLSPTGAKPAIDITAAASDPIEKTVPKVAEASVKIEPIVASKELSKPKLEQDAKVEAKVEAKSEIKDETPKEPKTESKTVDDANGATKEVKSEPIAAAPVVSESKTDTPLTPKSSKFQISDGDSDDEVDLLKEELTEVAI